MNSWDQKQGCGRAAQQEPAAAPPSRRDSADPGRGLLCCVVDKLDKCIRVEYKFKTRGFFCHVLSWTAHLNSTLLSSLISVVLAPHIMCPTATRVLESSWFGLCLVEFNTAENRAASWEDKRGKIRY